MPRIVRVVFSEHNLVNRFGMRFAVTLRGLNRADKTRFIKPPFSQGSIIREWRVPWISILLRRPAGVPERRKKLTSLLLRVVN